MAYVESGRLHLIQHVTTPPSCGRNAIHSEVRAYHISNNDPSDHIPALVPPNHFGMALCQSIPRLDGVRQWVA
eukprot:scaffold88250_cov54-Attheya_sp.AAC.1